MKHIRGLGAACAPPWGGPPARQTASSAPKASYGAAAGVPASAHVALYLRPKRTTVPVSCMRHSASMAT